jgi:hypothetical protein
MKKILLFAIFIFLSISLLAQYQVGDTVDDFGWTDNLGEDHSIYELTASGRVVVFFWGGYG